MVKKKKSFALIALMLTCAMLLFAACEPVGGLDLNKALMTSAEVESSAGKASLKLEVLMDESMMSLLMLNPMLAPLAEGVEIRLNEIKQQDLSTVSVKGDILVAGESVPIAMSVTQEAIVVTVDGITRPLVLDLTAAELDELGGGLADLTSELSLAQPEMIKAMAAYLIPNLPNPGKINVNSTTITINEQSKNVHKVHSEIYGDEVLDLLRALISNLSADEEGLRALLDTLYDVLVPIIDKALAQQAELYPDPSAEMVLDWIQAYLHNKTLVTEFLFTTITQGFKTALSEFDSIEQSLTDQGFNLLTPESYLKTDLYVDRSFRIVRTDFELLMKPELPPGAGAFGGIKLTGSQELWNMNEDVEADVLDGTNGIPLDSENLQDAVLYSVEPESFLGRMLRAVGLNTKQVLISIDDYYAYLENGVSMAEAYSFTQDLGIEMVWHWDEGRVVLIDPNSDQSVTLLVGQNVIYVDDEARTIPLGAQETYGELYLPVRAVAEAFGYDVQWDGDLNMVMLTKSYF